MCLFLAASCLPSALADEPARPPQALVEVQQRLLRQFRGYLEDPKAYSSRVQAECRMFPEGNLFPYLFPAFACANDALINPQNREPAQKQAAKFIEMAIPSVVACLKPPNGDLKNLESYGNNAVYVGQLNLALGAYRLIGGGDQFDALHRHLSDLLHQALVAADGRPLRSLPDLSWPLDTLPCLVSLKLHDRFTGRPRSDAAIRKHLDWVRKNATDKATGLPHSMIDQETGAALELPRGCDMSLRITLLANLDRPYAEELCKNYVRSHWLDLQLVAGFAEWPGGKTKFEDIDSGPIFMGVGWAATGLGVGATLAMHDEMRLKRLLGLFSQRDAMLALATGEKQPPKGRKLIGGMTPFDPQYYTGFLFGDAAMLYMATWQPWIDAEKGK